MGVRGLLSYALRHQEYGTTAPADLVEQAASSYGGHGLTLLVDLSDFARWVLPKITSSPKDFELGMTTCVCGGEFALQDKALTSLIYTLNRAGVYLDFFLDAPPGAGLVDAVSGGWQEDAKKDATATFDCAKGVRLWCKGEKNNLPNISNSRWLPTLWLEQVRATLERCGCNIFHLTPGQQAPLLSMSRNSDWAHVWGVVSDNIDWAVVRGVRLIPLTCFDSAGDLMPVLSAPLPTEGWIPLQKLSVSYTTSDLLSEALRLGHPPREEEIREAHENGKGKGNGKDNGKGKGKGGGKGPVGHGQWPWKWWFDQVLVEVAMLCGTNATTPFIQKLKLYPQLQLAMGADPVDSISRWMRSQLYHKKLRWRELQLEQLSPVLSDLVEKDPEFATAIKATRAIYNQRVRELWSIKSEIEWLRGSNYGSGSMDRQGRPCLSGSLFLRNAALASQLWLDVYFEDVSRSGSPLAAQLLTDMRQTIYAILGVNSVDEHVFIADAKATVQKRELVLPNGFPSLAEIHHWPPLRRWSLLRKIIEQNVLMREAGMYLEQPQDPAAPPPMAPVVPTIWQHFQATPEDGHRLEAGFLGCLAEYFISMNLRPEQPLIRKHELDSLLATMMLCCDARMPGSPLQDCPDFHQARFSEIKAHVQQLVAESFSVESEVHIPMRIPVVSAWFQGACQSLMDVVRLMRLDTDLVNSGLPEIFLPEPREIFSGQLFAGMYMGGAWKEWDWDVEDAPTQFHYWNHVSQQLMHLRDEVIHSPAFHAWRHRAFLGLHRGMISWPSPAQLKEEKEKEKKGKDELPIDSHRDKILEHIATHRVTCIQGETGCGKSTRVPVYVMEDYFERKRAGKVEDEDKFMVLCTQPRRIACISLANRVASCIGENLGHTIGYKISGDSCVRPGRTKLVYVTTGYLLQVLVNNPEAIRGYSHLILDEVHERDVDSDLLSLVVKLQMSGYNFRLVIMSATLQGDLFTRYFSEKKIKTIFVGVKRFPVEVLFVEQLWDRYGGDYGAFPDFGGNRAITEGTRGVQARFGPQASRAIRDAERCFGTTGYEAEGWGEDDQQQVKGEFDDSSDSESESGSEDGQAKPAVPAQPQQKQRYRKEVTPQMLRGLEYLVYETICRVANAGEGILVFLPGIGEISDLHEFLMPLEDPERASQMTWNPSCPRTDLRFKVFVLHSLIPKDEQEGAVFDAPPSDTCHVILASNIAESSLTIPKVRVVIDYGLRRQLVYDKRRHMSCLMTTWVSQASAKQRIGRTGRVFEGVAIRLFTKQFFETYMAEFDPPEMQTAPLEKLYVNVKHLSAKLPEYELPNGERRKRTPKELLLLTAQPPDMSSIDSSIEVLDQLGALTDRSEGAELTVLGYLMMSVPLDVHLCRLVIFGSVLGLPCEGLVIASALSVQDPFTLPSHLIIKDPREYAEAVRRSYESRLFFDNGHASEPLMLRNLFVLWISELRKLLVERCGPGGGGRRGPRRENMRSTFTRCSQIVSSKFATVPKRLVNMANSVLDTSQRMRKYIPADSSIGKKVDDLIALLRAGDSYYGSAEEADAALPKISDLFSSDSLRLKALLVMSFTPSFMVGSTKVTPEQPVVQTWGKKKKGNAGKDKNKMELLLDEFLQSGLTPERSIACQIEMPRGKGFTKGGWSNPMDDMIATLNMITCGEKLKLTAVADNKVFVTFDKEEGEEAETVIPPNLAKITRSIEETLDEETSLMKDLPMGAHLVDIYGAGRWKFQVPLVNSKKLEKDRLAKEEAARKAAEEREAARLAKEARIAEAKALREAKAAEAKAAREAKEAREAAIRQEKEQARLERERAKLLDKEDEEKYGDDEVDGMAEEPQPTEAAPAEAEAAVAAPEPPAAAAPVEKESQEIPAVEQSPTTYKDEDNEDLVSEEPAGVEVEADDEDGLMREEEEEDVGEELGPMIGIYKPVSPYELHWEVLELSSEAAPQKGQGRGKPQKKKALKGRCTWRNPVGFLGSTNRQATGGLHPWPNEMYAVFTATQGGDSKELAWVDGVTVLPADCGNLLAFLLLISFLRSHQALSVDVDVGHGSVIAIHGPAGLHYYCNDEQCLLFEDFQKVNAVRKAISEAFYSAKPPVPTTVDAEDGIDFTGTRGRRESEPVPQIMAEPKAAEALEDLLDMLRKVPARTANMSQADWNRRCMLKKQLVKTLDMHPPSGASSSSTSKPANGEDPHFTLFAPLLDLDGVKQEAERQQREEDERKRRAEEEKQRKREEERRKKEEERRRKEAERWQREEEKRQKKLEEQRRRDEQYWQQQQQQQQKGGKGKGGGKDAKGGKASGKGGKSGGKEVYIEPANHQQTQSKGGKKGGERYSYDYQPQAEQWGGKGSNKQQQQQQQQQQRQQPQQQAQQQRQRQPQQQDARNQSRGVSSMPPGQNQPQQQQQQQHSTMGPYGPLPPGWVAVPDPNTGMNFFWNQRTNETTWNAPTSGGGSYSMMPPAPQQDFMMGPQGDFGTGFPPMYGDYMGYPYGQMGASPPWQ